ncbi:hypothetical protein OUZ56_010668 [Daphnia magna]|uniref:Uncharacterized protein n=1 Tax=Daphnia magna TaxID=35525 RepID=A0ABR0AJK5_9CRUS|nr:hypothetical protein OUZ56_010668 [Daphnia magna]
MSHHLAGGRAHSWPHYQAIDSLQFRFNFLFSEAASPRHIESIEPFVRHCPTKFWPEIHLRW